MSTTDDQILDILLRDARTPHAQIAEEVGLSRPAVAERVKKLEHAGVIHGYSAVLNHEASGRSIIAFISAKQSSVLSQAASKALLKLADEADILEIHSVAGEDCFLIKVRTNGMQSLNEIVTNLRKPPLQMTTKTTIVLETYFEKVAGKTLRPEMRK
jgi:Lrp/AsnC family leucine-responsive transcriptional regulator